MAANLDQLPTIAFIGAGNMGGAIIDGLLASDAARGPIIVTNRSTASAERFAGLDGVTSYALETTPDASERAAADADIVVIGVKPTMVPDLLAEIGSALRPETIVVSIAAGVPIAAFEAALPKSNPVVRTMPNTPVSVGHGVTGVSAGTHASEQDVAKVRDVFAAVGQVVEVPESQLDALSTISGSGPAYVYQLIEDFTRAAQAQGFTPEQAALLAEQTFIGATALLDASDRTPEELRIAVTSPKGTTEQALNVLQGAHLDEVFTEATTAALKRAQQFAAGTA